MAGLTPSEVKGMTQLVAALPARGITVIWVEHVLYAIMQAAPRIMVPIRCGGAHLSVGLAAGAGVSVMASHGPDHSQGRPSVRDTVRSCGTDRLT